MNGTQWVKQAHKTSGWLMALGILEIILGIIVLSAPLSGGVTVTVVIGVCLMLGGIARLFAALMADSFGAGALAFLWGLIVAASGFYITTNPGIGLMSLTLVLSVMFFTSGLTECIVAFEVKPKKGWGWMLAGGILSVFLAIMVWRQFPISGLWLVGTLAGISLLANGVSTLAFARVARKATGAATASA